MTKQEIAEIEEEIYTDLSPLKTAAQELNKRLPVDGRTFSDETWHFFHFETEDYAAVKRTIELACRYHRWKHPALLPMDKFAWCVCPGMQEKKSSHTDIDPEQMMAELMNMPEIIENRPLFVCCNSEKNPYTKIIEAFILYCAGERNLQNYRQISEQNAFFDHREVPYYNRLFFVTYGSTCPIADHLKASLFEVVYPPLQKEDFTSLLWEYHLRQERARIRKNEARGIPGDAGIRPLKLHDELLAWYANSMAGLEELQVRRLLVSMGSGFQNGYADYTDKDTIEKIIIDYKNAMLKQHDRLEVKQVGKADRIIGLETIQKWLQRHKDCIGSYDESPTGILLVGIPGTGKSQTAKETARMLGLTLVQLDMSKILGGRVGDSEKGMREMLQDLQFVAPCVLWIDEVEKALSGADGKSGDSGTIQRLFGMLLTFIQDNDRPVFTVTTANDISHLPPEFFRNGRFNQTFCLMMPDYDNCKAIMQWNMNKYFSKLDWNHQFQLQEAGIVFDHCVGSPEKPRFLTGADIEAHVQELFWHYKQTRTDTFPGLEDICERMCDIAKRVRVQAEPDAKYTMDDIAGRYLDMMQRGLTMAGKEDSPYTKDKLRLDRIRHYSFEKDTERDGFPFCLEEPKAYTRYKKIRNISDEEAKQPSVWYDARFFYELSKAMSEAVFMDERITLPEVRSEYWKLAEYLHGKGRL